MDRWLIFLIEIYKCIIILKIQLYLSSSSIVLEFPFFSNFQNSSINFASTRPFLIPNQTIFFLHFHISNFSDHGAIMGIVGDFSGRVGKSRDK